MVTHTPRTSLPLAVLAGLGLAACGDDGGRLTDGSGPTSVTMTIAPSGDASTAGPTGPSEGTGTDATATEPTGPDPSVTATQDDTSGPKFDITGPSSDTDSDSGQPCDGLECQIPECGPGQTTTIRGTVYAPEGTLPLYNAIVYIPNAPVDAVPEGVTCDNCMKSLSGEPLIAVLTDTSGEFVLADAPAGQAIPIVLTIGKWRRQLTVDVQPCVENVVPADQTRLPRNQGEGHIPRIALTTGGADPLECLLRKLGMDDSEFTPEGGPGRVNLFRGRDGAGQYSGNLNGGAQFSTAQSLWNDLLKLKQYDMVMMACEGTTDAGNKSGEARANVRDFADAGGRLFLTHWHNVWIEEGADPWPQAANFDHQDDLDSPFTATIDQSFPKGAALAEWLVNVGGSDQLGEIDIVAGQNTINSVNDIATRWIYGQNPTSVQYFTFNAPILAPEEMQCGRVVDTDIHVSSGDEVGQPFPNGCETTELSPQEKALIFMFFELSACIIPDDEDPVIPG
jgi:hypothetical protein